MTLEAARATTSSNIACSRGDSWLDQWNHINISYFAPSYYRVFKAIDPGHGWDAVIQTVYVIPPLPQ